MLKNNKGVITISFLLVLIIILFFILSFFGLAMTFAHISASQYMAYSTARRFSLGGENKTSQKDSAIEHYKSLRAQFFRPNAHTGASGDWFAITKELDPTNHLGSIGGFNDPHPSREMFFGAGLEFKSQIAQFRIPFLIQASGSHGSARIISFLGREPSQSECEDFNKQRGQKIHGQGYSFVDVSAIDGTGEGDNGC